MSGSRLFLLLLQLSAFAAAADDTVCRDSAQGQVDEVTLPPPVDCDNFVWTDDDTLAHIFVEPEEVEFVAGDSFTVECKVCTRTDSSAVIRVKDIQWSKQGGELPSHARISKLDLNSRPAVAILLLANPHADDVGVYKCTPTLTKETVPEPAPGSGSGSGNGSGDATTKDGATNGNADDGTSGTVVSGDYAGYCTVKQAVACAGDDPRFSLPLADGNMLCFTVDGKAGDIFNLISDEHISVNVRYIGGKDGFSVWMGEVAVVVDGGCKVRVTSKPESVFVDSVQVNAYFSDEDVTVDVQQGDYVTIKLRRPDVQFRVEFIDEHLSFYIVSGDGFSSQVHGLLGQFWNSNHNIHVGSDQKYGILKRKGRAAALLMKQKRWPFMHGHKEDTCWTVYGKQPKGAVDWTHSAYKMKTLCQSKPRILKRLLSE